VSKFGGGGRPTKEERKAVRDTRAEEQKKAHGGRNTGEQNDTRQGTRGKNRVKEGRRGTEGVLGVKRGA